MDYYKMYVENEGKYVNVNNQKFKKIIELFGIKTGIIKLDVIKNYQHDYPYVELYYNLRDFVLTKYPEYTSLFYEMLNQAGFSMDDDIFLAMRTIGSLSDSTIDKNIKDYFLLSPYIDNITISNGKFNIYSNKFGEYSFYSIYHYLKSNETAMDILKNYRVQSYCHHASWELIKYLDDANLVTCLLPSYFDGNYYHTLIRDKNGFYIDVVYGCVYDKEIGEKIFANKIVSDVKKEDLDSLLEIAKQEESGESKREEIPSALLLTLHNQNKRVSIKR